MNKKWECYNNNIEEVQKIAKNFNVSNLLATILSNKNISSENEIEKFLNPTRNDFYDPFLMPDMKIAVDRILEAMSKKEKIIIYGDYDVDGITSITVLKQFLEDRGIEVGQYIPNRLNEGYGLNKKAIEEIVKQKYTLMITVDCGISGVEEVEYANSLGIETIITDHHEQGEEIPNALAVVDAKRKDNKYPFNQLAGVGVVFKLIQALGICLGLEEKEYRFDIGNLKWRPSTVNRLMHNELYIGKRRIVFYKPDPSNSTPIKARGNREVIYDYSDTIEDLRIVSDELFQSVQDKLAKAHYNKNNAIKHENLLKHLLTCGECGANFTVGKSALTARNYVSGERTYKCYGRVNRKDKPQTCNNGAQVLQWKLDGLVLQLSIQMFAQINIEQSNILRIENLEKEREGLLKVKVVKEREVAVIEDNYRKTIKRLMYLEDDNIVKTMLREEKTKYDKVRDRLEKDLDKLSKEIISKGVAINNLKRLNSNSVLKSKMNEIRNDKTLVITMINEYVDNIVIYRMHPWW